MSRVSFRLDFIFGFGFALLSSFVWFLLRSPLDAPERWGCDACSSLVTCCQDSACAERLALVSSYLVWIVSSVTKATLPLCTSWSRGRCFTAVFCLWTSSFFSSRCGFRFFGRFRLTSRERVRLMLTVLPVYSLVKHRWEHSPHWHEASKFLLSKHQQVQLLEVGFKISLLKPFLVGRNVHTSAYLTPLPRRSMLMHSSLIGCCDPLAYRPTRPCP